MSAQKEKPRCWVLALVPLFGDDVGGEWLPRWEEAKLIRCNATAAERKDFYYWALALKWLPSKAGSAFAHELGTSLRKRKSHELMMLQYRVDLAKKYMRKEGERPRGGIHEAAYQEIAEEEGTTAEALKKQLKRFRQREPHAMKKLAPR
jgi:hypothetical protein